MGKLPSLSQPSFQPDSLLEYLPTVAEFCAEKMPERSWLCPRFTPTDSIILLSGQKKRAQKTWFAMANAVSVSTGRVLGPFEPASAQPVLFVEEEGSRLRTKQRWEAICRAASLETNDLTRLYFVFRRRVKLDDPRWVSALVKKAKETRPSLVVFDALAYLKRGDENNLTEMLPVLDALYEIRGASAPNASVMVLAHLDKARGASPGLDIDDQVRGSGVFTDAYDLHLALRRYASRGPLQLIIRARDEEEKYFQVTWKFEKNEEDKIWAARLTALPLLPQDRDREAPETPARKRSAKDELRQDSDPDK